MADTAVVERPAEGAPAPEPQTPVTDAQTTEQAMPVSEAVADTGAGEAVEPKQEPQAFDLNAYLAENPDKAKALQEQFFADKENPLRRKLESDAANAAIQRARREAGKAENVKRELESFARQWGVDPEGLSKEERAKFGFLTEAANSHAAVEAMKALAAISLQQAPEAVKQLVEKADALASLADRDPEAFGDYAFALHEMSVEAKAAEKVANLNLKDIPEGSRLHKDIADEVSKRLTEELAAAKIEARPAEKGLPSTPAGGSPNTGKTDREKLLDPATPVAEIQAILARQRVT